MKFFFLLLLLASPLWGERPGALVSVAPHKFFVEKIAADTLKVMILVPETATPHGYEPPPREILEASRAAVWFRIGEGFEKKALEALKAYHPDMTIVDLRKDLPLIPATEHTHTGNCCSAEGADPHIWLSLKLAQIQSQTIADALIKLFPEHEALYRERLKSFLEELQALDQKIQKELLPLKGKTVMVSHPAYAYFCRDYGLYQLSIEMEGKDPSPKTMTHILQQAKKLKIKTIFTQPQYGKKGAELIANLIGASLVELNPYAENYLDSVQTIAEAFRVGL